jgi:L-asparaginase II
VKPLVVEVWRGQHVESRHSVHVVACELKADATHIARRHGDARFVSFVRSAIKMFQALPLVEDGGIDRFNLTSAELAVTTASHSGEPLHVAAVRSILHKAGLSEQALACGAHPPMHQPSANTLVEAGLQAARVHNNCSGKHAGMLALSRLHAWRIDGYHESSHPVQQRVVQTLAHWADVPSHAMDVAVDGCGLPTFALPLDRVAAACARFAATACDRGSAAGRVFAAMAAHPEYVAGTDRLCTEVMRVTEGRVFAKVGAEGYYCAGSPEARLGIALKVEDGAKRAAEAALIQVLHDVNLVRGAEHPLLAGFAAPPVLNTRGEQVGRIEVRA